VVEQVGRQFFYYGEKTKFFFYKTRDLVSIMCD